MNVLSVFLIAAKRLWNNKGLTLCSIVGLITAVALISSVPLYSETANFKVLKEQLTSEEGETAVRARPPFAFMYRYIGAWHGPIEIEDFDPVDEYITTSVPGLIALPQQSYVRHVKTDNFSLFPASEAAYIGLRQPLGWVKMGFVSDLQEHIHIVAGEFAAGAPDPDYIDVLISASFAGETGMQVGETTSSSASGFGHNDERGYGPGRRIAAHGSTSASPACGSQRSGRSLLVLQPQGLAIPCSSRCSAARGACRRREVYAAIWYHVLTATTYASMTSRPPGAHQLCQLARRHAAGHTVLDIAHWALQNYRWTTFG